MKKYILLPIFLALALSSCSLINQTALRTTGEIIQAGSDEVLTENNYENFKLAAPANLKLIEGLWFSDKENKKLLTMLIKGYGSYAFAVSETEALGDILFSKESKTVDLAIINYQKAIKYSEMYLKTMGIETSEFWEPKFPSKLLEVMSDKYNDEDLIAMFYFAQSLAGSLNLQRKNMNKISQMEHVKKLIKWVCNMRPNIERGSCSLLSATMKAALPSMMGGNQSEARTMYLKLIQKQPHNLLAHVSYIQYHIIPLMDEDEFEQELNKLSKKISDWYRLQKGQLNRSSSIYKGHENFNLFNSIAKQRFETISSLKLKLID